MRRPWHPSTSTGMWQPFRRPEQGKTHLQRGYLQILIRIESLIGPRLIERFEEEDVVDSKPVKLIVAVQVNC